ncbi:MAG: prepilin-type N-terminal cleavage/methylation domain-containing protein [Abditibacteriaceae bacterium]
MKPANYNLRQSKAGFTLVEILVVLVIASILAAVTLGGYSAMRASNRRTSCQANMAQIYQSIRLYTADYNGQVPYYDPGSLLTNGKGLGLWALFTYASDSNSTLPADANVKPEKRYLSNPKLFHCPSDIKGTNDQMFSDSANSVYSPSYLSYQSSDTGCSDPSDATCGTSNGQYGTALFTYNPIRTTNITDVGWQRQLLTYNGTNYVERPPTDDTVVLWCPFHRGGGGASSDNVLFWDGTIQNLPEDQGGANGTGAGRTPKAP